MKVVQQSWWIFFVFMAVISCSSSIGDTTVQLRITSDPASTTIGNALVGGDVQITLAKVVVSDVEFERSENCALDDAGETEIEYEGPYVVNLLTQKSYPSLNEVVLAKGHYCEFKFSLEKLNVDEVPTGVDSNDEIIEASMYIEGTYHSTTPLIVRLEEDESFEMESESSHGLNLSVGEANTLFLMFDLSKLFEGVDLSVLDLDAGTIVIDKNHNQTAYQLVRKNIKTFSKLFKDSNDDDELDDDDDTIATPIGS